MKLKIIEERILSHEYNIETISKKIPDSIKDLCMKLQIQNSSIIGIGIGIVGGFNVTQLKEALNKELNTIICIDNGANAAVIGEYHFGIGKGKKNLAYINCGVGVRTGIISSGVLIRTINNLEDAFGHMIVDANGELCSCGNRGCIESYVSISNITKKFIDEMKKNNRFMVNKELNSINYMDVCNLAERNNEYAVNIIKNSAFYFGIGLANYIKLFNPELIILSGPLIYQSNLFYDTAKEVVLQNCHIEIENIEFSKGGYFDDTSIAVGACAMVIEKILK